MFFRVIAFLIALFLAGHASAQTPPSPKPPAAGKAAAGAPVSAASTAGVDASTAKLLAGIRAADKGQLAVSEEDGRFLRVLVGAIGAKQVLEIGAASGYSAIWIGLGLRQTGGKLVTIEYDPIRAKEAAANIQRAGLSGKGNLSRRVEGGDADASSEFFLPSLGLFCGDGSREHPAEAVRFLL